MLQPILGDRNRELLFDSRDVFFNGGVDIVNETITFQSNHNLLDGQLVYYSANNNQPIGIGTAFDLENKINGTLSDGAPYYVRSINPSTVRIFNTANRCFIWNNWYKHSWIINRHRCKWYSQIHN